VSAETAAATQAATAGADAPYPFAVLSDPALTVIDRYGVADPEERDEAGGRIARPAVILLDRMGVVRFAHVGEHARDRPTVAALLLALETIA